MLVAENLVDAISTRHEQIVQGLPVLSWFHKDKLKGSHFAYHIASAIFVCVGTVYVFSTRPMANYCTEAGDVCSCDLSLGTFELYSAICDAPSSPP